MDNTINAVGLVISLLLLLAALTLLNGRARAEKNYKFLNMPIQRVNLFGGIAVGLNLILLFILFN